MATLVWQCKAWPPLVGQAEVARQLRLSELYYNKLVEIERARRAQVRAVQLAHSPELAAATEAEAPIVAQIQEITQAIRARRAAARTGVLATQEEKDALAALREAQRGLWDRQRRAKLVLKKDEACKAALKACDREAQQQLVVERARCGVAWGGYLKVEARVEQAAARTRDPRGPRFRPAEDGAGLVPIQLQGMTLDPAWWQAVDARIATAPEPIRLAWEALRITKKQPPITMALLAEAAAPHGAEDTLPARRAREAAFMAEWVRAELPARPKGGLAAAAVFAAIDPRLAIEELSLPVWRARRGHALQDEGQQPADRRRERKVQRLLAPTPPRTGKRAGIRFGIVTMRLGASMVDTGEKKGDGKPKRKKGVAPIVQVPVELHRDFPQDAMVSHATLVVKRVGRRLLHRMQFTIETSQPPVFRRAPPGSGTVALNLGWRTTPRGLRVAFWADSQGQRGEILVPPRVVSQLVQNDELRSARDLAFEVARGRLVRHLSSLPEAPPWLSAIWRMNPEPEASVLMSALRALRAWRRTERLGQLIQRWAALDDEMMNDSESALLQALLVWRREDEHLHDKEAWARYRALVQRRQYYRRVARVLAERYERVLVDGSKLAGMREAPEAEEGTQGEGRAARRTGSLAAPGELRDALVRAVHKAQGQVGSIDPAGKTAACHGCGLAEEWDRIAEIEHRCGGCGRTFDQDHNFVLNALREAGVDTAAFSLRVDMASLLA